MGLGFTLALALVACVRELLGSGSLFGMAILPEAYPKMTVFILPAGAFFALGFVIAAVQKIRNVTADRAKTKAAEQTNANGEDTAV